jgi:integrase
MATLFKRGGKGNWIMQWFDAEGQRVTKSSRTSDHAAASRIAAKYEADAALRREGVIDLRLDRIAQQSGKTISSHLDDFGASMRSKSGAKHIDDTRRMIERLCNHAGWTVLREVDADGCNYYAEHLLKLGRSSRTVHAQLTAIRTFITWAVRTGRLAFDPLATVAKPNVASDRRIIRRMLSHDEFQWIDSVTRQSGESYGMSGHARSLLYSVAIQTGLRAGELRELTRGKFHLTGKQPFILADAKTTKNKKQARQYVTAELAAELREFVGRMVGGATVFNLPPEYEVASMLRGDMAAARAEWLETFQEPQQRIEADASDFLRPDDSEGERLDFHSLRHTCASWLIAAGAEIKTVQVVMRHSDIRLTMDRYGHLFPGKEAEAIDLLGSVFSRPEPLRATGTVSKAQHIAQHSARETVQFGATERSNKCSALAQEESRLSKQNIDKTQRFLGSNEGSGGGIRTPDTRIMIPLL